MNYQKHYDLLIERAQKRIYHQDVYTERHHIIPRCMGGDNSPSNLVKLLPEEHLFAHRLLCRIHPHVWGLASAVILLSGVSKGRVARRAYAMDRIRHAQSQLGKKATPEARQKMSDAKRGTKLSEAHRQRIIASNSGSKRTDATRKKMSDSQKKAVRSEQAIKNMNEAQRRKKFVHTPEARQKIGEANRERAAKRRYQTELNSQGDQNHDNQIPSLPVLLRY